MAWQQATTNYKTGMTAEVEGEIAYLKSLFAPHKMTDVAIPDTNLLTRIPKSVKYDHTFAAGDYGLVGSGLELMVLLKHHDTQSPVSVYARQTVVGINCYWWRKTFDGDTDLATYYRLYRPVSNITTVKGATISTTTVNLNGTITAIMGYAAPADWRVLDDQKVLPLRATEIDAQMQVPLSDGVTALAPPPSDFGMMFRVPYSSSAKNTPNSLDVTYETNYQPAFSLPFQSPVAGYVALVEAPYIPTLFGSTRVCVSLTVNDPVLDINTGHSVRIFATLFGLSGGSPITHSWEFHMAWNGQYAGEGVWTGEWEHEIDCDFPILGIAVQHFRGGVASTPAPNKVHCQIEIMNGEFEVDGYSSPFSMICMKGLEAVQQISLAGNWNYEVVPNSFLSSELKGRPVTLDNPADMHAVKMMMAKRVELGVPMVWKNSSYEKQVDQLLQMTTRKYAYGYTAGFSDFFQSFLGGLLPIAKGLLSVVPGGSIISSLIPSAGSTSSFKTTGTTSSLEHYPVGLTASSDCDQKAAFMSLMKDKKEKQKVKEVDWDVVYEECEEPMLLSVAKMKWGDEVELIPAAEKRLGIMVIRGSPWILRVNLGVSTGKHFKGNYSYSPKGFRVGLTSSYSVVEDPVAQEAGLEALKEFILPTTKAPAPVSPWSVFNPTLQQWTDYQNSQVGPKRRSFYIIWLDQVSKQPQLEIAYVLRKDELPTYNVDKQFATASIKVGANDLVVNWCKGFDPEDYMKAMNNLADPELVPASELENLNGMYIYYPTKIDFKGESWIMGFLLMAMGFPRVFIASGGYMAPNPWSSEKVFRFIAHGKDKITVARVGTEIQGRKVPILISSEEVGRIPEYSPRVIGTHEQGDIVVCFMMIQVRLALTTYWASQRVAIQGAPIRYAHTDAEIWSMVTKDPALMKTPTYNSYVEMNAIAYGAQNAQQKARAAKAVKVIKEQLINMKKKTFAREMAESNLGVQTGPMTTKQREAVTRRAGKAKVIRKQSMAEIQKAGGSYTAILNQAEGLLAKVKQLNASNLNIQGSGMRKKFLENYPGSITGLRDGGAKASTMLAKDTTPAGQAKYRAALDGVVSAASGMVNKLQSYIKNAEGGLYEIRGKQKKAVHEEEITELGVPEPPEPVVEEEYYDITSASPAESDI